MNKNRMRGGADQGERANDREAPATKDQADRLVAANSRRWWCNSAKLLHTVLPTSYYNREGVPRLAA